MERLHMTNKKFNKTSLEILRNIELLCFIKPNKIKKFSEILKSNLNNNQKQKNKYTIIFTKIILLKIQNYIIFLLF